MPFAISRKSYTVAAFDVVVVLLLLLLTYIPLITNRVEHSYDIYYENVLSQQN